VLGYSRRAAEDRRDVVQVRVLIVAHLVNGRTLVSAKVVVDDARRTVREMRLTVQPLSLVKVHVESLGYLTHAHALDRVVERVVALVAKARRVVDALAMTVTAALLQLVLLPVVAALTEVLVRLGRVN